MALLMFEGWDNSPSTPDSGKIATPNAVGALPWSNLFTVGLSKVAGQLGGSALRGNSQQGLLYSTGVNSTTLFVGTRFRTSQVTSTCWIMNFWDGGTRQCSLGFNSSGKLFIQRGYNGGTTLATGTTALSANAWNYVEWMVTFNGSTGAIALNLNGNTEIALTTGLNTISTANAQGNGVSFVMDGAGTVDHDDNYLCDSTGPAPTNTFLGPCRIETLFPTGTVSTQFTPNASTNLSQIQETTEDGDSTFNSAQSAAIDLFTHGALSSTPQTIFGVMVQGAMRKDDNTSQTARTKLVSGTTTQNGSNRSLATSYQYMNDVYLTDPNTGNPWQPSAVNNSQIGYENL